MGPSVKFVSPNSGLISTKKNWGKQILSEKDQNWHQFCLERPLLGEKNLHLVPSKNYFFLLL